MRGYRLDHPSLLSLVTGVLIIRVTTRHIHKDIQFKELKILLLAIQLWLQNSGVHD